GCRTGFYLLVRNADNEKVLAKVKEILGQIVAHDGPMFGATRKECGNYRELSVEAAKEEAARYLAALETGSAQFVYPTEG
ncbi:MAG: S-ribosylhomocysteine lyase, partial [Clostridia bacterium]|nr:S-ribosylhomocysteine lyase [Clostridia bacterium]